MTDLFVDIRDGVKLMKLLEVLTGQKLVSFSLLQEFCFADAWMFD